MTRLTFYCRWFTYKDDDNKESDQAEKPVETKPEKPLENGKPAKPYRNKIKPAGTFFALPTYL